MQVDVAGHMVVRGMGRAFQMLLQKPPKRLQGEIVNVADGYAGPRHGVQVGTGDARMDAAQRVPNGRRSDGKPR